MKVYGYEVPDETIKICESAMVDFFTCGEIESIAKRLGAPTGSIAMRIADRLIQKHKRAGRIRFDGKVWRTIERGEE